MRRALSSTSASNELMRRCLLRWQDERLFPTFCVFEPLCHGFSPNERFLRVFSNCLFTKAISLWRTKFLRCTGKARSGTRPRKALLPCNCHLESPGGLRHEKSGLPRRKPRRDLQTCWIRTNMLGVLSARCDGYENTLLMALSGRWMPRKKRYAPEMDATSSSPSCISGP